MNTTTTMKIEIKTKGHTKFRYFVAINGKVTQGTKACLDLGMDGGFTMKEAEEKASILRRKFEAATTAIAAASENFDRFPTETNRTTLAKAEELLRFAERYSEAL